MKLKHRLFLWVGSVFFILIVISSVFDGYFTRKNIQEAEVELKKELIENSKKTEDNIENFLRINLSFMASQIDTVLSRFASFAPFRADFAPSSLNLTQGTWAQSANLMLQHPWADFIQSSSDDKLLAQVLPKKSPPKLVSCTPIEKGFSWIKSHEAFWIGISVDLSLNEDASQNTPSFFVLFTPEAIRRINPQSNMLPGEIPLFPIPGFRYLAGAKQVLERFIESIQRAKIYLATNPTIEALNDFSANNEISCASQVEELLYSQYQDAVVRRDELLMIWAYSTLLGISDFGPTPFSPNAPVGIAHFSYQQDTGRGFFADQAFSKQKAFDDEAFFNAHPSSTSCSEISSGLAIVAPQNTGHAFLANTLRLGFPETSPQKYSYLTIGMDVEALAMQLALSLHQKVLLVHAKEAIALYSEKGEALGVEMAASLPLGEMLSCRYGVIPWQKESYFYQNLAPLNNVDLHFFTFNEESEEFALIQSVQEGATSLASDLTGAMRTLAILALLCALFIIYRLANRFTKPISQLAKQTGKVASAHFDDIQLPEVLGKHDEIAVLVTSFKKMIQDLKEREKVKGILNKIVSPQIAAEILEKGVVLGGEKRQVTILFADIRGFTNITQHQKPEKTIQMLNECMTRISRVIDQHGAVIDKYIGDAVMALFNVPIAMKEAEFTAIKCALAILQEIKTWDETLQLEGATLLKIGIGIHTGDAIAGNMGAENRLNYTVIGANVNLASRICSLSCPMELLVSEATYLGAGADKHLVAEKLEARLIKGFDTPIILYRVLAIKE